MKARKPSRAARGIRAAVLDATDAAQVVQAMRRMAPSPHDPPTLRPIPPPPKTPRAQLLALANAKGERAETWRRALVVVLEDLNRTVHHERFRRRARLSRVPASSRIDLLPLPGGASVRVALGEGASLAPKVLPAFRDAVRLVAAQLLKPKRGPFKVSVRFDRPEDESRPALHWPLGMGPESTALWNDLLGEPPASPWRRIQAVPSGSLARELKSPPAALRLPPAQPSAPLSLEEALALHLRARARKTDPTIDRLLRRSVARGRRARRAAAQRRSRRARKGAA